MTMKIRFVWSLLLVVLSVIPFCRGGHAQSVIWAQNFSNGFGTAFPVEMVTDANGNILMTGVFTHPTDFDPGPGTYQMSPPNPWGYYNVFVLKLDSNRNFLWAENIGSTTDDFAGEITVDAAGNVYVVGNFRGTCDFDPGPGVLNLTAPVNSGTFIQKLTPAGSLIWAKVVPGEYFNQRGAITLDGAGNIFVAADFSFSGDFDPGAGVVTLNAPGNRTNGFILKLDANGDFVWVKLIEGTANVHANEICLDGMGNIYASGLFGGTTDFNPGIGVYNLVSAGFSDSFVLKLNAAGNFVWAKGIQGPSTEVQTALAVSPTGVVTLVGNCHGAGTDFDPGIGTLILPHGGGVDYFAERLDSAGNLVWARKFGGLGGDNVGNVRIDSTGAVYLFGYFGEVVDFDPGPNELHLSAGSEFNIFFQKLDSAGNLEFAKSLRSGGISYFTAATIDEQENIIVTGWMRGVTDCDPGPGTLLVAFSLGDVLLAKYRQDSCFTLALSVDSIRSITCQNAVGYGEVGVFGAFGPATVTWNTTPATTGLSANFTTGGTYTALVTDARGCAAEASVVITAPQFPSGVDLATFIVPSSFMPGFASTFQVNASNYGCTPANGQLKLTLDTMLAFTSAVPAPTTIIGDTLVWNFSGLAYGSPSFNPAVTVTTPVWAMSGDGICLDAKILPIVGDLDTANNRTTACVEVTSSFDPNDKRVDPPGQCDEHFVFRGQPLHYTVRFQNTGTAAATTVRVVDGLDWNVDLATFRVMAHSHPMTTQVLPGNILEFTFDNIQLPDSNTNEPASHGYLAYEIMPTTGITAGTAIRNRAGIYFDFNEPVFTERTISTIVDTLPVDVLGDTVMVCQGGSYTFQDGFTVTNITGNFSHGSPFTSIDGCPAVLLTQLYMSPVDTGVAATASTLAALGFAFNYQWLDCNNNYAPIPGANGSSFTPTSTGSYAVEINQNGCVDTSSCYFISTGSVMYYYDTTSVCFGDDFTFHDGFVATNVTSPMSHTSHFMVSGGDSAVVTALMVTVVDTAVTVDQGDLTSYATNASFQWLDCINNYAPIPGATDSTYFATVGGIWAVQVTQNSCVDTSSCYEIIYISAGDPQLSAYLRILPNPTSGRLHLYSNQPLHEVVVTNLLGFVVLRQDAQENFEFDLDLAGLAKGMYFLRAGEGLPVQRLVFE